GEGGAGAGGGAAHQLAGAHEGPAASEGGVPRARGAAARHEEIVFEARVLRGVLRGRSGGGGGGGRRVHREAVGAHGFFLSPGLLPGALLPQRGITSFRWGRPTWSSTRPTTVSSSASMVSGPE